ncbi:hypothetical protein CONLIGDRAFT_685906 [Coniochaeta ligniaria NRRL 30616]|uniref:Uncharacterized protein n=1 Tax=Coniochaeta ligniaria NRRL 30616 TaxID=1408157 RepID=A0A1J7J565_9PEZI|nr:hypothetical protein CONLIGDRAFT_685906 [Coniochaeta ligniaria NRRL 30616]
MVLDAQMSSIPSTGRPVDNTKHKCSSGRPPWWPAAAQDPGQHYATRQPNKLQAAANGQDKIKWASEMKPKYTRALLTMESSRANQAFWTGRHGIAAVVLLTIQRAVCLQTIKW